MPAYTDLRIDSVFIYQQIARSLRVDVISTGAEIYAEGVAGKEGTEWNLVQTWTYTGENTFLGFSTNSSSSFPDSGFAVGESTTYGGSEGTVNLYSVETISSVITDDTKVLLLNGDVLLNNGNVLLNSLSEKDVATGTITFTSSQQTSATGDARVKITHNLGRVPVGVLWMIESTDESNIGGGTYDKRIVGSRLIGGEFITATNYIGFMNTSSSVSTVNAMCWPFDGSTSAGYVFESLEPTITDCWLFIVNGSRLSGSIPANTTIRWVVW